MKHLEASQQVPAGQPPCNGIKGETPVRQGLVTHRKRVLRSQ